MKNEEKQEAAELAGRAKRQGRNAARNGIKAVEAAAEPVIDSVAEEIHDTADKLNGTANDAVRSIKGRDVRQAVAVTAVFLGGTYLVGRFVGAREARAVLATKPID